MIDGIEYNAKIKQYVATAMTGAEACGATWADCEARLREANRAYIEHCQKCQEEQEWELRQQARRLRDEI